LEYLETLKNILFKESSFPFTILIVFAGISILYFKEFISEWGVVTGDGKSKLFCSLVFGALTVGLYVYIGSIEFTKTIIPSIIFMTFAGISILFFERLILICFRKVPSGSFWQIIFWALVFGGLAFGMYTDNKELALQISFGFLISFFLHFFWNKFWFWFWFFCKFTLRFRIRSFQRQSSYHPFVKAMIRFFKGKNKSVDDLQKYIEGKKNLIHEVKHEKLIKRIFISDVNNFCKKEPHLMHSVKDAYSFLEQTAHPSERDYKKFDNDARKFLYSYQSCFKEIEGFEFDKHLGELQSLYNKWKEGREMKFKDEIEILIKHINTIQVLATTTKEKREIEFHKEKKEAEKAKIVAENAKQKRALAETRLSIERREEAKREAVRLELERQHKINAFPLEKHVSAFVGRLSELDESITTETHDKFLELYESMNNRFKELGLLPLDQLLYVSNDAHLLNQKAIIIDLFSEKIKRVKKDPLIDDEEQFMKVELWRRIQDRYLNQLA